MYLSAIGVSVRQIYTQIRIADKYRRVFFTRKNVFETQDSVYQRLNFIVENLEQGNQAEFARRIGVRSGVVGDMFGKRRNKPSFDVLSKIATAYPQLRMEWLLTGEGEMLKTPDQIENSAVHSSLNSDTVELEITEALAIIDEPEIVLTPGLARSEKLLPAVYEGKLAIGDMELSCAVLADSTRIITYSSIFEAFGRTKRGAQKDDSRVHTMPAFLNAQNLQPFVDDGLRALLVPIDYTDTNGNVRRGYNAMILPRLCKVYLDARNTLDPDTRKPILSRQQEPLARASEILLLGLSNIGIVALIDEATGYQYERERDELQKILQLYVAEELRPWAKTFPDTFYQEIFRLNGWAFTVGEIKKRPPIIGKWTNGLIYEQLPKGVLKELKEKTPKSEAGNYVARFFQSLTDEIGVPGLQAQINSVLALMQVSDTWHEFMSRFNKLVQRRAGQLDLMLTKELPAEPNKIVVVNPPYSDGKVAKKKNTKQVSKKQQNPRLIE